MPTNLPLNEPLIAEAIKLGHFKSKAKAINTTLDEYVRRKKQASILDLFGKIDYYPEYDHKKLRSRKLK